MLKIKKSVLVVDDDPDIQAFIEKILSNLGYEVLLTNNTEDAFALVLDNVPHLILLDIRLEGELGFSLLEMMEQVDLLDKINVFMISSNTSKGAIAQSKKYGVEGFMIKPLSNNALINAVKNYVRDYSFPELDFKDENEKLTVQIPGEMVKINEVSFVVRSKIKFNGRCKIEIESNFLQELEIHRGHFKVYQASRDIKPGLYDTIVQFLGLPENTLQRIRRFQTKKV